MGIKERQERDREAVRRSILDAARDLFVTEGFQNVSIRKIAEKIEYSPAAIYGYFAGKDDIFFALAEEGFRLLCDGSRAEARGKLTPLDQVRIRFERLYEFSREQPQYFALMFLERSVPRISKEYERFAFAREMKGQIRAELQACIDAGDLPKTLEPTVAMRMLTVGLLGLNVLKMSDRLAPGEDADALAADVLDVVFAGLKTGVTLRSKPIVDCPLDESSLKQQAS
ncbi:MAG TPA: TetR/AcrR family transcriptional regulator [Vicinamibacterales bacterium]|nr:TetR/AcrR family transcriptional regulator [Vicinamibacterales bacterium]